jgi:hypothetical protein
MDTFRCPHLDQLGRELVDAYRNAEDRDIFCISAGLGLPNEIEALHLAMAEHRRVCPLCLQGELTELRRKVVQASTLPARKENRDPMS